MDWCDRCRHNKAGRCLYEGVCEGGRLQGRAKGTADMDNWCAGCRFAGGGECLRVERICEGGRLWEARKPKKPERTRKDRVGRRQGASQPVRDEAGQLRQLREERDRVRYPERGHFRHGKVHGSGRPIGTQRGDGKGD